MTADRPDGTLQATVIVPTIEGRGPLLPLSVGSVLAQTVTDIEVFIIGDGVDEKTRLVIHDLMNRDARIRFFDHEKHERRGEPNRHAALAEARGEIVCYLSDRDLMLPHHVENILALLQDADFAHTLISAMTPEGGLRFMTSMDLSDTNDRKWILSGFSLKTGIPLAFAGHSLEMYRKLPHGWRTTPPKLFTDIYMWEQFLAQDKCRAVSGTVPTILYFPSYWREGWSVEQKLMELRPWSERIANAGWKEWIMQLTIDGLAKERLSHRKKLDRIGGGLKAVADIYNQIMQSERSPVLEK